MTSRYKLRTDALLSGQRYFEDARACKHCGGTVFYACNGGCMTCPPRAGQSFIEWAHGQQLTGRDREIAEQAWRAAKGRTPMPLDDTLRALREAPGTTPEIAARLRISRHRTGILLRRLRAVGLAQSTLGRSHVNTWSAT
ncbi:helix-turn-helix domain-containing protein [Pseudomonas sp.]|uniref:MarR family transcriptional regulator n=1 Tax=Pseudomonas sp. TaxID=306 RepID=UPI00258B37B0|nr:helix-turn-helix domain-containing protein [Pseudomonas sp.]